MAYSLNGENVHYGTPINPRAPGRIPGGSSSGSAVAVAGGLVDFALGTDCGGSVRLPASYCGIFGIRTTHGLVPADGVVDLAKSFDTVGWFARDAAMMLRVGEVLLPSARDFVPKRLLIAEDAFAFVGAEIAAALATAVAKLKAVLPDHRAIKVYTGEPSAWSGIFRILQGDEIRTRHSAWIDAYHPSFGPGIAERFAWTRTIEPAEVERMRPQREAVAAHMDALLGDDAVLCLPTAPGIAPKLGHARARARSLPRARLRIVVDCRACAPAAAFIAAWHIARLPAGYFAHCAARPRLGASRFRRQEFRRQESGLNAKTAAPLQISLPNFHKLPCQTSSVPPREGACQEKATLPTSPACSSRIVCRDQTELSCKCKDR